MKTAALLALAAGLARAAPTSPYTITVGAVSSNWKTPDDTPAASYIDKDGSYYFQQAHALYGATQERKWNFYAGTHIDDATKSPLSNSVNPADARDSNADTTWRCNNSPTGKKSTPAVGSASYAQANYCDLTAMWVDPDTGDWYGLVHNEFTPQPFADGLHYDAIDYAVSTDQGKTWNIKAQVITSPYSTLRNDTAAFPQQTYHYGVGDPRILADPASGYFYVWYGSRIVNKGGSWVAFHEHVARAPMWGKMAPGTWRKYYAGTWTEPGLGGRESNLVPVTSLTETGYTPPEKEYKPITPGRAADQVAAGTCPPTSPLFVMDVSYSAHLGVYIGEPQAVDQSGNAPQEIYYTTDLATQKWRLLGNTGSYKTASWYRWFLDPVSRTQGSIVGRDLRAYCSFGCSNGASAEYVNLSINGPAFSVIATGSYSIAGLGPFRIEPTGDGAYTLTGSGGVLGVDASTKATRAWGTKPGWGTDKSVGRQWWIIKLPGVNRFRLINRYSGLALAVRAGQFETTPVRMWNDTTGSPVGGGRTAQEQDHVLTAA
ncbi:hypothetical protein CC85DRAFT_282331 [Cutaneotrichosporon oleaginosum]|uniref:Ricin B lectin domain-containing protein n=1 Tax=Cutaneotrichosporon oleaginosum TaxID=879819 RepID=A0A0J0XXC9_9TREE|nr:uncharacterized protein CC85DRAFT_282331 [Cutaneotrichosporon oleaginosum]KLT45711.1 hypothetical protein CC85DRAFT_282331 [Cutaneotrichosporon oleaginosum]TXT06188.1 hypothetical protein COLE_05519 [Cutaneotrichosporon oleaginosum]